MVSEVEARCPLILEGLETFPPQIAGDSTLQAMLLAVRLAGGVANARPVIVASFCCHCEMVF